MPGTICQLFLHPIKSCQPLPALVLDVDETGPVGDRQFMVVDANGRFISQRTHPRLATVRPLLAAGQLRVEAPAEPPLELRPDDAEQGQRIAVTVWRDVVEAVTAGPRVDAWFSRVLGERCHLVHIAHGHRRRRHKEAHPEPFDVHFADSAPFLLIGQASLDDLNARLAQPLPMQRFRPNIVVAGTAPFAEDDWQALRIGAIEFPTLYSCDRCTIPTIDQISGERGVEPLKTLARYRTRDGKVWFGQRMIHRGTGRLRVGDAVEVLARSR